MITLLGKKNNKTTCTVKRKKKKKHTPTHKAWRNIGRKYIKMLMCLSLWWNYQ